MKFKIILFNLLSKLIMSFGWFYGKLNYYFQSIKYKGSKNIPIKEIIQVSEETSKIIKIVVDSKDLCTKLKIDYYTSYIGLLYSYALNSNFKNEKDLTNYSNLLSSSNHRLLLYQLLIDNNNIQKDREKHIMSLEEYDNFINWLNMSKKDDKCYKK